MKKIFVILLAIYICQPTNAKPGSDNDNIKALEGKYIVLQNMQVRNGYELRKLTEKQQENERKLKALKSDNERQSYIIDSLRNICKQLIETQTVDRKNTDRTIAKTNHKVQTNQETLQSRMLWIVSMVLSLLLAIVILAYRLAKRIKSGNISIDEVRKAQEALQSAQTKMQEESVKLDDKLLELFNKQLTDTQKIIGTDTPDHSLALKVADEIVRIELNMSRMDSSIKGYKQLTKAVERIKDNFKANGYEIVDMLGKPYNEGMKVTANFVVDEDLEEGKQIITGITKPQINYNGQMIQAAQITVSQNI